MRILITGAGGQLGQEWIAFCTEKNIPFCSFNSTQLDITDADAVAKEIGICEPNIFINCAAYTKVDAAEDDKILANKVNAVAVKGIAEVCAKNKIKLVHYSTDYVFSGKEKDRIHFPDGYSEDHKTDPVNEYGRSKRNGEEALFESDCDYLLIRVAWLCGRFGNNFVKTMLKLGESRKELNVVNDQFGSPTFVDQVVEQSFALLQGEFKGIFHLSSSGITSWDAFANEIFSQSNMNVSVKSIGSESYPTKAKRPTFSKLSTRKISNIDGIEIVNWKDGLNTLLKQL